MGFNFLGSKTSEFNNSNNSYDKNVNPDPYSYSIKAVEEYDNYYIALIKYFGCTTFDGHKLLLIDKRKIKNDSLAIDPHLLGNEHFVIARFEPNPDGWNMARKSIS